MPNISLVSPVGNLSSTCSSPSILTGEQAVVLIETWSDLPAARRRDLTAAVTRTAGFMSRPLDTLVLTPQSLRAGLLSRPPRLLGLAECSFRNLVSMLRRILERCAVTDSSKAELSLTWAALIYSMPKLKQPGVIGFGRFCSFAGIAPDEVNDEALEAFKDWLERRTLTVQPSKAAGKARSAWNSAVDKVTGWPQRKVSKLRLKGQHILPIGDFPSSFQEDVKRFGSRLAATAFDGAWDDDATDEEAASVPSRLSRPISVALRESHCRWAASALVASGVPIDEITALSSLVSPIYHAREILRFLYTRGGSKPSAGASHVADVLMMVARHHVQSPKSDLKQIEKWRAPVRLKYEGMTQKNEVVVAQLLERKRQAVYLKLPDDLMKAVRKLSKRESDSPEVEKSLRRQAAGIALRATAIGLLQRIPLRLSNLIGLRLDEHLERADPPYGPITYIHVAAEDTKNRNTIRMPVSPYVAKLLQGWIDHYRPIYASPGCPFVFPGLGTSDRPITPQGMRDLIKETLKRHLGIAMTPHQFRHVAASIYLDEFPGHLEDVQRLLGHKDIKTTSRAYRSRETSASVKRFDDLMDARRLGATSTAASQSGRRTGKSSKDKGGKA